jgi:hypothetical protein
VSTVVRQTLVEGNNRVVIYDPERARCMIAKRLDMTPKNRFLLLKRTGQSSSEGVPRTAIILFNWSTSVSPGKKGFRSTNSTNIVPMDQMSIPNEYDRLPHNNSGGRYHLQRTRGSATKDDEIGPDRLTLSRLGESSCYPRLPALELDQNRQASIRLCWISTNCSVSDPTKAVSVNKMCRSPGHMRTNAHSM